MVAMADKYIPQSLEHALHLLRAEELTPYAGGTDLMVQDNRGRAFLFLHAIPELKRFTCDEESYYIGAGLNYNELIENPQAPSLLRQICASIGATPLRNEATIGGNVANASPKGDAALGLVVADAIVHLASADAERQIPIRDFYTGRGETVRQPDELLVGFTVPRQGLDDFRYEKVGGRAALAISRVSFAGLFAERNGQVAHLAVAFGAIEDTIVCHPEIDAQLIGKTIPEARQLAASYLNDQAAALKPIRGRVSTEYRRQVCVNLLSDFIEEKLALR
jgi:CO/xanthine dehydrogenase FAD-binding subunit